MRDQFLRPAKLQSKWYGLFSDHKVDPSAVSSWNTDASKLNSSYSRIARQPGSSSSTPASRRISQETLHRWENRSPTIISSYANRHRNLYLLEALHQLMDKDTAELVQNKRSLGFFQPTFLAAQNQPQVETHTRPEQSDPFPQGAKIQNGDTGNHQNLPPTRGVGYLNRLQGCLLPYTNTGKVQEISEISHPSSDIPVQGSAIRFVHSIHRVHW